MYFSTYRLPVRPVPFIGEAFFLVSFREMVKAGYRVLNQTRPSGPSGAVVFKRKQKEKGHEPGVCTGDLG